jgi:serine/threonine protein kinase
MARSDFFEVLQLQVRLTSFPRFKRKELPMIFKNQTSEEIEFLEKFLDYDPNNRISAYEALFEVGLISLISRHRDPVRCQMMGTFFNFLIL